MFRETERERERETETERDKERETERDKERQRQREKERERSRAGAVILAFFSDQYFLPCFLCKHLFCFKTRM